MSIISSGESFGETGLFLDRKLPMFAKAIVDSCVLVVPAYVMLPLLDANKDIARNMQDKLVINIHQMIQSIEMLTLNNARQRFINYLLQISEDAYGCTDHAIGFANGKLFLHLAFVGILRDTPHSA